MKNWNKLIKERSSRTDRQIKPQYIADILSDELEDNAIISVDSGTVTLHGLLAISIYEKG